MKRPNVLVSAYACRPNVGSEPGVGWDFSLSLARYCNVWVITRENNRCLIEAELAKQPIPNLKFIFCDFHPLLRRLNSNQRLVYLHYYLWQILAFFVIKPYFNQVNFDLIHHVTYVRYWSPSFLIFFPVPFIWGPVGGGESVPVIFLRSFSVFNRLYEGIRYLVQFTARIDPFVQLTALKSAYALVTTHETGKKVQQLGAKHLCLYSQLGLSSKEADVLAAVASNTFPALRFVSIGRLLHWKGFHLGLRAFAETDVHETAEYWIIGDGPERTHLELLSDELGITHRVKFWGKLPREQVLSTLGQCLALVHPSLHESGGLVCLEALAAGRPVICLDLGGPAVLVSNSTGFKISPVSVPQVIQDMAIAMSQLAVNQDLWLSMSQAGKKRVADNYIWEKKIGFVTELYEKILN